MSVIVVLIAILAGLTGLFIAIHSTDTKTRVSGMVMVTFVTGFLAAGAAAPQQTIVEKEPDPAFLKGCSRVWILTDTTHDDSKEENSLAELEEAGRERGCSVKTTNTSPPRPSIPHQIPPPDTKLPEEGQIGFRGT